MKYMENFSLDTSRHYKRDRFLNTKTGEIFLQDPNVVYYDSYVINVRSKFQTQTTPKKERYFHLIVDFHTSLKKKYS